MLNIALPKGRLGEKVYAILEAAGFSCPSIGNKAERGWHVLLSLNNSVPHLREESEAPMA